jgi:multidrug efflux pump subunit AcrA (membrane-fusion protein)
VRVIPENRTNQSIVVPFDAVFWDEENSSHVWVVGDGGIISARAVRTGRTFGDAVEISDGLRIGETYVSLASDDLKAGTRIEETAVTEKPAAPEGDGHGHAHEE